MKESIQARKKISSVCAKWAPKCQTTRKSCTPSTAQPRMIRSRSQGLRSIKRAAPDPVWPVVAGLARDCRRRPVPRSPACSRTGGAARAALAGTARTSGSGRARYEGLDRAFGTLADAWHASPAELRAAGLDDRSVGAIEEQRPRVSPEAELAALDRLGVIALIWHDERYPRLLKESFDRPPVLYIRGSVLPDDDLALAVVGTRKMSRYGQQVTEQLVPELVRCGHYDRQRSGAGRGRRSAHGGAAGRRAHAGGDGEQRGDRLSGGAR